MIERKEFEAKTQRTTAAKEQNLESFRRELVRTHHKLNEMIDDKRRSCPVKSEFEKLLHVVADNLFENTNFSSVFILSSLLENWL